MRVWILIHCYGLGVCLVCFWCDIGFFFYVRRSWELDDVNSRMENNWEIIGNSSRVYPL